MKKDVMPLKEYSMKIQQCVNALALVGMPMSKDDHILYILVGLDSEYESMISVISARTDSPSVQDITSLLLTQETRNESKISVKSLYPGPILLLIIQKKKEIKQQNQIALTNRVKIIKEVMEVADQIRRTIKLK